MRWAGMGTHAGINILFCSCLGFSLVSVIQKTYNSNWFRALSGSGSSHVMGGGPCELTFVNSGVCATGVISKNTKVNVR
jgi:hypothetical protein